MSTTTDPSRTPITTWLQGARPRTLPAAVVPVAVGTGVAAGVGATGDALGEGVGDGVVWWRVVVALAVALLLQIGVNYANDYSDGVRGTDDARVGPLRLVASGAATPGAVRAAALATLGLAGVLGIVLAATTSWWLLAIGAVALLASWGYTGGPRPYGYLGLGELFVFVFFGLVATVGTTYVAGVGIPTVTWPAAVAVGLLACALLVINNLRDIPTDRKAGKRTLAVRIGETATRRLYAGLVVTAFLFVAICGGWRPWALLALFGLRVARDPIQQVIGGASGPDLIPVLGETGRTQMVFGALFAIGLAIG